VGNDVAVDALGNVYVVGTFAGEMDVNPARLVETLLSAEDSTDGYLVRFSPEGRLRFATSWGADGYDGLTHVAVDSNSSVIVAGYFEGDEFDADPTPATRTLIATPEEPGDDADFVDVFVEKLTKGRVDWVQQLRGTGVEFVDEMKLDRSEDVVISGSFYGRARFGNSGPSITSVEGIDDFDDRNDGDRENSYDVYLWNLANGGGATSWVRTIGIDGDDFGAGLDIATDGSILQTGRFRGLTDFDQTSAIDRLKGLGLADAFVTQYDEDGLPLL
jgi:hypothetical protein